MSYLPTPDECRPRGRTRNSAEIIVNGRRTSLNGGISGRDLANMVGGYGRRPVKIRSSGVSLIDRGKYYTDAELTDRNGKPVKVTSVPDRTKGSGCGMERALAFLDFANVQAGGDAFGCLDYGDLRGYLGEGRHLVEAYAYVPIDPRRPEARNATVAHLQNGGWMVNRKMGKIAGDTYKSNVDVEMCIDIMRTAQLIRPDIIVICSGDGDFLPIVRELRRMGIRAEVASFEGSADAAMSREASGFISLDVWQSERAALEDEDEYQAPRVDGYVCSDEDTRASSDTAPLAHGLDAETENENLANSAGNFEKYQAGAYARTSVEKIN